MAGTENKKSAAGRSGRGENVGGKNGNAGMKAAKTGGRSKTGGTGKGSRNAAPPEPEDFIGAEVLIILSFAAAVLLFLSNFHLCGVAGNYLRTFQLGLFGSVGFVAPFLLFTGTCFYLSNQGNRTAMRKMIACVAAVLVLCGFAQLLFGKRPEAGTGLMEYYRLSSETGIGGGLTGGLICVGLTSVLGNIGAFLVLVVCFAISVVCITERSLVKAVKKQSGAAYRYAREDMDRRREVRAEKQKEQHRLREEQKVRGVDFGATVLTHQEEMDESYPYEEYSERAQTGQEGPAQEVRGTGSRADERVWNPENQNPEGQYISGMQTEAQTVGDSEISAQLPPEDDIRAELSEKQNQKASVDPADIFVGKIVMPAGYGEEDMAPFEEDEVLSPAESAQRLVAEGISRLTDLEGSFGRPVEPPPFHSPAAEPAFHGLETASEELPVVRYREEEEQEIFMGEPEIGINIRKESQQDQETGIWEPEEEQKAVRWEPEEDQKAVRWEPEEDPEEEGPDPAASEISGRFVIPEEKKRVVTAFGKVIESDTEALQKRLESRRREAQEAREAGEISVGQQIREKERLPKREYVFPPVTLLKRGNLLAGAGSRQEYKDTAIKLQQTLRDFGVGVTVTNISCGPSVTRYELHPEQGVKVSKIVGLADDIKLSLAAEDIRIEAPIPGKSAVGIEVPNKENTLVYLRELLESESFREHPSKMAFAVGKDIGGQVVVTDIAKMPHLLIAGATGSGKSVCINTLIMSILFKASPEEVKLIMIDPKVVELSVYNGIPHLLIPVVTDPKKASGALNWAVAEMQNRYNKFAECNVRNLSGYNARIDRMGDDVPEEEKPEKMPQIIIIVDELADLMMVAPGEVEDAICRLAQLARAAGIHLVIATQRPSVNVITGLIKANVPSRIAFSVSSGVDSRTIIDMYGAEKLLGKGDMLFFPSGIPKPQRVQGAFVSDSEVQKVVEFLTEQGMSARYNQDVERQMSSAMSLTGGGNAAGGSNGRDDYFEQAGRFIIEKDKASIGMLQRMFKIGFNRAARIMDQLAEAGIVGEEEGTKPRKILVTMEEFEEILRQ